MRKNYSHNELKKVAEQEQVARSKGAVNLLTQAVIAFSNGVQAEVHPVVIAFTMLGR